jgi:hypothetical protein
MVGCIVYGPSYEGSWAGENVGTSGGGRSALEESLLPEDPARELCVWEVSLSSSEIGRGRCLEDCRRPSSILWMPARSISDCGEGGRGWGDTLEAGKVCSWREFKLLANFFWRMGLERSLWVDTPAEWAGEEWGAMSRRLYKRVHGSAVHTRSKVWVGSDEDMMNKKEVLVGEYLSVWGNVWLKEGGLNRVSSGCERRV